MLTMVDDVEQSQDDAAERRIFSRAGGNYNIAEGRRLDHTIRAHRNPKIRLRVNDVSVNGMSAISDAPAESGEHLGIYVPNSDGRGGWGALGRVVRCEPAVSGYRIALAFDPLPAA